MKIARKIFNFIDRYQYNELYSQKCNNIPYEIKIKAKFGTKRFLPKLPRLYINTDNDKGFALIIFLYKPHLLFNRRKNIKGIDEYLKLLDKRSDIFKMYWFSARDTINTMHLKYILDHLSDDIENDILLKNALEYVNELIISLRKSREKMEQDQNQ